MFGGVRRRPARARADRNSACFYPAPSSRTAPRPRLLVEYLPPLTHIRSYVRGARPAGAPYPHDTASPRDAPQSKPRRECARGLSRLLPIPIRETRERGDRGRLKAGRTHNCDSAGTTRAACTCIDVSTPAWVSRCRSPGSSPSRGSTPARRIPCRLQRIVTRCRDCAPISFSLVSAERRETSLRESRLRSRVPNLARADGPDNRGPDDRELPLAPEVYSRT